MAGTMNEHRPCALVSSLIMALHWIFLAVEFLICSKLSSVYSTCSNPKSVGSWYLIPISQSLDSFRTRKKDGCQPRWCSRWITWCTSKCIDAELIGTRGPDYWDFVSFVESLNRILGRCGSLRVPAGHGEAVCTTGKLSPIVEAQPGRR